jgi:hypothetical protein
MVGTAPTSQTAVTDQAHNAANFSGSNTRAGGVTMATAPAKGARTTEVELYFARPDTPSAKSPVGLRMVALLEENPALSFEKARTEANRTPRSAGRYDRYSELDPTEARLISVGHFLWRLCKREREPYLLAACEAVWGIKKKYRVELAARRDERAQILKDAFVKVGTAGAVRKIRG